MHCVCVGGGAQGCVCAAGRGGVYHRSENGPLVLLLDSEELGRGSPAGSTDRHFCFHFTDRPLVKSGCALHQAPSWLSSAAEDLSPAATPHHSPRQGLGSLFLKLC